jgi:hypothetical protein
VWRKNFLTHLKTGGPSSMPYETHALSNADEIPDVALHDEIKRRAYELYKQRHTQDGHDLKHGLQSELPLVFYAAAEVEKYALGEEGDTRAVRAARVYLCALSSYIGQRDGE